jgi:hypothetical protein
MSRVQSSPELLRGPGRELLIDHPANRNPTTGLPLFAAALFWGSGKEKSNGERHCFIDPEKQ